MITLPNMKFTSGISLVTVLATMTKVEMLNICKKLDLYVSPNLKKDETARRVAQEILDNPVSILCLLNKTELKLLDELEKAGPNKYIVRKMRKTFYKLQKFGLVLTYEDEAREEWNLLMPDCVRESLADSYAAFLDLAEKNIPCPSAKELRMRAALNRFFNEE